MRYKLRTLLILLAIGPPVLAGAWWQWQAWCAEQAAIQSRRNIPVFAPADGVLYPALHAGMIEPDTDPWPIEPTTGLGPVITVFD